MIDRMMPADVIEANRIYSCEYVKGYAFDVLTRKWCETDEAVRERLGNDTK